MKRYRFRTHIILLTVISIILLVLMFASAVGGIVGIIYCATYRLQTIAIVGIVLGIIIDEIILILFFKLTKSLRDEWVSLEYAVNVLDQKIRQLENEK